MFQYVPWGIFSDEQRDCSLASSASSPPLRLLYPWSQKLAASLQCPPFCLGLHAPPCKPRSSRYVLLYYHLYFISPFLCFLALPLCVRVGYVRSTIIYIYLLYLYNAQVPVSRYGVVRRSRLPGPKMASGGARAHNVIDTGRGVPDHAEPSAEGLCMHP